MTEGSLGQGTVPAASLEGSVRKPVNRFGGDCLEASWHAHFTSGDGGLWFHSPSALLAPERSESAPLLDHTHLIMLFYSS